MSELLRPIDARAKLAGTNRLEILLFSLGEDRSSERRETYGINVFKVREVMRTPAITRAPEMPPSVEGMVSLRGTFGVLMQSALRSFVLAVDGFVGRDDVVIKPLQDIKPNGIAGATLSGDGSVVLVLDIEQLVAEPGHETRQALFKLAA